MYERVGRITYVSHQSCGAESVLPHTRVPSSLLHTHPTSLVFLDTKGLHAQLSAQRI